MKLKPSKRKYVGGVLTLVLVLGALWVIPPLGGATVCADEAGTPAVVAQGAGQGLMAIAIALAIGLPCLGAGYAVGRVGAAALGAASERPELLTRSLIFVALAEGIAIYGLLVAVLLWRML